MKTFMCIIGLFFVMQANAGILSDNSDTTIHLDSKAHVTDLNPESIHHIDTEPIVVADDLHHHQHHHHNDHVYHHNGNGLAKVVHHNSLHYDEPVKHITKVVHNEPHHFLHYKNQVYIDHPNYGVTHSHGGIVHKDYHYSHSTPQHNGYHYSSPYSSSSAHYDSHYHNSHSHHNYHDHHYSTPYSHYY